MTLLQATMAVTLAAMTAAFPNRPGLAFGLPSLALLLGAAPGFAGGIAPGEPAVPIAVAASAAAMLFVGIGLLKRSGPIPNMGMTELAASSSVYHNAGLIGAPKAESALHESAHGIYIRRLNRKTSGRPPLTSFGTSQGSPLHGTNGTAMSKLPHFRKRCSWPRG
jgi:hypothetical protein